MVMVGEMVWAEMLPEFLLFLCGLDLVAAFKRTFANTV